LVLARSDDNKDYGSIFKFRQPRDGIRLHLHLRKPNPGFGCLCFSCGSALDAKRGKNRIATPTVRQYAFISLNLPFRIPRNIKGFISKFGVSSSFNVPGGESRGQQRGGGHYLSAAGWSTNAVVCAAYTLAGSFFNESAFHSRAANSASYAFQHIWKLLRGAHSHPSRGLMLGSRERPWVRKAMPELTRS
jgi:hypothetical protein